MESDRDELIDSLRSLIITGNLLYEKIDKVLNELRLTGQLRQRVQEILEDPKLSGYEKIILVTLAAYPRPMRQRDIINYTRLNPKTVRKHLQPLLLKNLVKEFRDQNVVYYALP